MIPINGNRAKETLVNCESYIDTYGTLCLKLIYEYEDKKGVHELIFPCVELPYEISHKIPAFINFNDASISGNCMKFENVCHLSIRRGDVTTDEHYYKDVFFVDYLKVPKVYEMTLEEIEKELGYAVKIISTNKEKEQNVTC